jgi:hypothetical protein
MTFKKDYFVMMVFVSRIKRLAIVRLGIEKGNFHNLLTYYLAGISLQKRKVGAVHELPLLFFTD